MDIPTVHQSEPFCDRLRIEEQFQRCVFIRRLSTAQRNNTHFTHSHCKCTQCAFVFLMWSELLVHMVINAYLSLTGVSSAPPIRTRTRNNLSNVLLLRDMMDQELQCEGDVSVIDNFTATQSHRRVNHYPSYMFIHYTWSIQ